MLTLLKYGVSGMAGSVGFGVGSGVGSGVGARDVSVVAVGEILVGGLIRLHGAAVPKSGQYPRST